MKRYSLGRRLAGLLLGVCLLAALFGCRGEGEGDETIRIGVALYQQDDTFIATVAQHLEQCATAEEEARGVKLTLTIVDGRGSQSVQNEQVGRFLSQGYDVVCVNIVDRTAAAVIIDKAREAGTPVVFFNREPVEEDMDRWEQVYYVGSDGAQSGQLQGEIVLDAWRSDPAALDRSGDGILQYVMLEGEPGHQDALLRTEHCIKVLTRAGVSVDKLANDTANWNRGQATEKMSHWLARYGDEIEVVFANNDDMALGAIDACLAAGKDLHELPFIVGVDATPPALEALEGGALRGTVHNNATGQAEAMLALGCALARDTPPEEAVTLTDGKYVWLDYVAVTPRP